MYQARRPSRSTVLQSRRHSHHLLHWGDEAKPILLLCHGWMDVGASFQFLVDEFSDAFFNAHHIVALDWRGFGLSSCTQEDGYWFPDYLGDLDAVVDHVSPQAPIKLLGHSMGGNVVTLYAGVRPERLTHLINLEGFGMPKSSAAEAPGRYARWLDAIKRGESMNTYTSYEAVAKRLMKNNPRLASERAEWLARVWSRESAPGVFEILGDPAHKLPTPTGYRVEEVLACWSRISAPTLVVVGGKTELTQWWQQRYTLDEFYERLQAIANHRVAHIERAGHMLHHEEPAALAQLIEAHCAA